MGEAFKGSRGSPERAVMKPRAGVHKGLTRARESCLHTGLFPSPSNSTPACRATAPTPPPQGRLDRLLLSRTSVPSPPLPCRQAWEKETRFGGGPAPWSEEGSVFGQSQA